jgi:hypothetical protein
LGRANSVSKTIGFSRNKTNHGFHSQRSWQAYLDRSGFFGYRTRGLLAAPPFRYTTSEHYLGHGAISGNHPFFIAHSPILYITINIPSTLCSPYTPLYSTHSTSSSHSTPLPG